jgi:hypothetical protein
MRPVLNMCVGIAGIVVAFTVLEGRASVYALVMSSVIYVAWTAGRWAGVWICIIAALAALLNHGTAVQPGQATFLALLGLWTVLCLAVALAISAVERGTRPKGARANRADDREGTVVRLDDRNATRSSERPVAHTVGGARQSRGAYSVDMVTPPLAAGRYVRGRDALASPGTMVVQGCHNETG